MIPYGRSRRILFVVDTWHPQINGVITVVESLRRELELTGNSISIMEPNQFFTVPIPTYREFRMAIFAGRQVYRRIKNGQFDEIHLVNEGPLGWYARSACRKLNIPFSSSYHNQYDVYASVRFGAWIKPAIQKLLVRFHSAAFVCLVSTESLCEELRRRGLNNVHVWKFGLDLSRLQGGVCPIALARPVYVFVGRIAAEKQVDEFLALDLTGTKLVIGDGPERARLQKEFPTAKFVGFQSGVDLADWFACSDVLVMPSRAETFGLVMTEALSVGTPVAAHDCIGPRDIVRNGENGYLDEDLAVAARKCLALSRERCKESVRSLSWRDSAARFLDEITRDSLPRDSAT